MRIIGFVAATIGVAATVAMFATLLAGSVLRYALGAGLTWSADLCALLFPWAALGGVVLAHQQSGHVAVEFLVSVLPARIRHTAVLVTHILIATTGFYLVVASLPVLEITRTQLLSVIDVPLSYAYLSLPCGMAAIGLVSLVRIAEWFRGASTRPAAAPGGPG